MGFFDYLKDKVENGNPNATEEEKEKGRAAINILENLKDSVAASISGDEERLKELQEKNKEEYDKIKTNERSITDEKVSLGDAVSEIKDGLTAMDEIKKDYQSSEFYDDKSE